jgi:methylthioribose-1-phosphate isomerase
VAAPFSTFDLNVASGRDIPIEHRSEDEVRRVMGQGLVTLPGAQCWNPAFDVTPPELVTAIVTERGVIRPPFEQNIKAVEAG